MKAKNPIDRLADLVDMTDVFVFTGLGLVGYGLHQIYAPIAFVVVGAALFWLGVRR